MALDELIARCSLNWKVPRMGIVDRNILRLSAYELAFESDVPSRVTLNEAIELAKRYGTEDSGAFVNGILDRIAQRAGAGLTGGGAGGGGRTTVCRPRSRACFGPRVIPSSSGSDPMGVSVPSGPASTGASPAALARHVARSQPTAGAPLLVPGSPLLPAPRFLLVAAATPLVRLVETLAGLGATSPGLCPEEFGWTPAEVVTAFAPATVVVFDGAVR
jgi:hypothetical protein